PQHIVANRVHERSQALRMQDFSLAQSHIEPDKGLLTHIFDGLSRRQSGTQFYLDQSGEIGAKMLLRAKVSRPQTRNVGFVKGVELQEPAPGSRKWQPV